MTQYSTQQRMLKAFFLLLVVLTSYSQAQTVLTLNSLAVNPSTIGSSSTTISFQVVITPFGTYTVPANAVFVLTFPSGFTSNSPTCSTISSPTTAPNLPPTPTCTPSGNQITFNSGLSSSKGFTSITLTYTGFTNANIIDYSGYFNLQILDSSSAVIAKTADSTYKVTLTSAVLSKCQLTGSTSTTVGTNTNILLDLTTVNVIPIGGIITLTTPVWNSYAASPSLKYFGQSNTTCSAVTSNVNSGVACAFDSSTGIITINNGFTAASATGSIQILISNLRTPLNTGASPSFSVNTMSAGGVVYEYCNSMTFQVSNPGTIGGWSIACEQTMISAYGYCDMKFKIGNPLPGPTSSNTNQISIVITVPSEMTISAVASLLFASPTGLNSAITPTVSGNVVALNNIVNTNQNVAGGSSIEIVLTTFQNPASLAPTSSFAITTYSGSYKIDETTTGFTFQASQGGSITVNSISAANLIAGTMTSYSFNLTLTSALDTTSGVYIKFPSVFALDTTCSVSSPSSNINSSPICTPDSTNIAITLSNMFIAQFAAGGTIWFTISGIRNPQSTEPTSALTIKTLLYTTNSASSVDQNTATTVSFIVAGYLDPTTVSMTPTSLLTSDLTTYTFKFTNTNPCPIGGRLDIQFTAGVLLFPLITNTKASLGSLLNINPSATVSVTVGSTSVNISLSNAFSTTYAIGTPFSFSLSYIRNPPTTQPFTGIMFTTYTATGYVIDTLVNGVTVSGLTPNIFSTILVTPSTLYNGGAGNYQTSVTLQYAHYNGDQMIIAFPSQLTFALANVTILTGSNSDVTVTAYQSLNTAVVNLTTTASSIPSTSQIILSIYTLTNTAYSSTIGTFTITTQDSGGFLREQSTYSNSAFITVPALLPVPPTTVIPSNTILSQTGTSYVFTISRVNDLGSSPSIEITFPAEITAPTTPSCAQVGGITDISCSYSASSKIIVTGTSFSPMPTNIVFSIGDITNPSVNISGSFIITTKSGTTIVDQRTTDLRFNAQCDPPCKECSGSRTTCTSCFTDSSSLLTLLSSGTCVSTCPTGSVAVGGVCTPCTSPCAQCYGTPTNCTTCITNTPTYYISSGTCVTTCPPKYYQENSTYVCASCSSTCDTCSAYDKCLTCPTSPTQTYLYGTTCLSACPAQITILVGTVCQPCNSVCATCSGTVDNCVTCQTGTISYLGQCMSSCPATLYYDATANTCLPCTSPCKTCSGSTNACTSCINNYLYGSSCVDTCVTGYYPNATTLTCDSCPSTCLACTSNSTCQSCKSTYLFYQYTCVSSCPTGTYTSSATCVDCDAGCSQCSGTSSNCLACKTGYVLATGNTCVALCAAGYFQDVSSCTKCPTTCGNCTGSAATDCTSCVTGTTPYLTPSGACSNTCPDGYYGNSTLNLCMPCSGACSTCYGPSASECTTCNSLLYLYSSTCVIQCPLSITVADSNRICQNCAANCLTCSGTTSNCASCTSPLVLKTAAGGSQYCGTADTTTPTDPTTDPTTDTTTTSSSSGSSSGIDFIPFPFLILGFTSVLIVFGSKAASKDTLIPGNLLAFFSLLLYASAITWLVLRLLDINFSFDLEPEYYPMFIIMFGLALGYFDNLIHLCLAISLMTGDPGFSRWRERPANRRTSSFFLFFSTLTTFNFYRIVYNRLFGIQPLSANLKSEDSLKPIHCITMCNVVLSMIPLIGGAGYQMYRSFSLDQISITAAETALLGVLCVPLCIWDLFRSREIHTYALSKVAVEKLNSNIAAMREGKEKVAPIRDDPNKSKLGLLEDESRIDGPDPESYYAGGMSRKPRNYPRITRSPIREDPERSRHHSNHDDLTRSFRDQTRHDDGINDNLTEEGDDMDNHMDASRNVIFHKSRLGDYTTENMMSPSSSMKKSPVTKKVFPHAEQEIKTATVTNIIRPVDLESRSESIITIRTAGMRENRIDDLNESQVLSQSPDPKKVKQEDRARAKDNIYFTELQERQERAEQERKLAEEKAEQERKLAEEKAAQEEEERRLAEEKAEQERKLAEEKAAQEEQERKLAEEKAEQERKLAEEQAEQERKLAEEKAEAERKLAEEKEKETPIREEDSELFKLEEAKGEEALPPEEEKQGLDEPELRDMFKFDQDHVGLSVEDVDMLRDNPGSRTSQDKINRSIEKPNEEEDLYKRLSRTSNLPKTEKVSQRSSIDAEKIALGNSYNKTTRRNSNKLGSQVVVGEEETNFVPSNRFQRQSVDDTDREKMFSNRPTDREAQYTSLNTYSKRNILPADLLTGNKSSARNYDAKLDQETEDKIADMIKSAKAKEKARQKTDRELEFCDDSKASVSDIDNFVNEESPSNYNVLNQRYEDEEQYGKDADNYISLISPITSLQKVISPEINAQRAREIPSGMSTMMVEHAVSPQIKGGHSKFLPPLNNERIREDDIRLGRNDRGQVSDDNLVEFNLENWNQSRQDAYGSQAKHRKK